MDDRRRGTTTVDAPASLAGSGHRLPGLDGLRAASIAAVVLYHAVATPRSPLLRRAFQHGGSGVEVFFVLSGFLITWLLIREEAARGRFSLGHFYARRAVRIPPPVLLFVALIPVLEWARHRPVDWRGVAAAAGFCRNVVDGSVDTEHFWTLAIEEQFYLVGRSSCCSARDGPGCRRSSRCCWSCRAGARRASPGSAPTVSAVGART